MRGCARAFRAARERSPFPFRDTHQIEMLPRCESRRCSVQIQLAQLREELERKLRAQLGPAHLPDVIEAYPISARHQETATGPLDEAWVQSLFASGLLQRKAELAPFRSLSALRTAALRTPLGRLVAATDPGPPTFHDDKDDTDA